MSNFGDELKKVLLAGIGAVAVTAEKSSQMIETLVKKGELTVEQGKILNEELKNNIKESFSKAAEPAEEKKDDMTEKLESMSAEELEELKKKIQDIENNK